MAGIISRTIDASGIVLPDPLIVDKSAAGDLRPPLPRKGYGGRLGAVYGNVTAAGHLKLYDGIDTTGLLIADLPLGMGNVGVDPVDASWRFVYGVYAEFADGLAGDLSLNFT